MKNVQKKIALIISVILLSTVTTTALAEKTLSFVHSDHLGTPRVITNQDQDIVWQASYTPFGEATVTTEMVKNNLRFPGQYFDSETGLHYNYFRYYDPSTGRYITSDPRGILLDFSEPSRQIAAQMGIPTQSLNLQDGINHSYNYAKQNPLIYTDPTGEFAICLAFPWGTLACGVAAVATATSITQCSDKVDNYCEQQYPNWANDLAQNRSYVACRAKIYGATGSAVGAASDGVGTVATEVGGAVGEALSN